jgi:hypothetical protein
LQYLFHNGAACNEGKHLLEMGVYCLPVRGVNMLEQPLKMAITANAPLQEHPDMREFVKKDI